MLSLGTKIALHIAGYVATAITGYEIGKHRQKVKNNLNKMKTVCLTKVKKAK